MYYLQNLKLLKCKGFVFLRSIIFIKEVKGERGLHSLNIINYFSEGEKKKRCKFRASK